MTVAKRLLLFSFAGCLCFTACTKFDTTNLGSDLLPAVDNVNTFADTLSIVTTQGVFNDSLFSITSTEEHLLGKISSDPLFGTTQADVYCELKPINYPYIFGNPGDTLNGFGAGLDSVVLCLKYNSFWGDSATPIQFQVFEVNATGAWDSIGRSHKIDYAPSTGAPLSNPVSVDIRKLGNWVKFRNGRDSVQNQIRIPLSSSFANALWARDTLTTGNNSFRNDSLYRLFQKGFAIKATGPGNALIYTTLADAGTRLEVHYRRKNQGRLDTTYSIFRLATNTQIPFSSTANNIVRNRGGFPVVTSNPGNEIYLQAGAGTFANLDIPALTSLSNRVVHRAEIIIEQVQPSTPFDNNIMTPPNFLYLDLRDTSAGNPKYKPIYFDLNPEVFYDPDYKNPFTSSFFPTGGVNSNYFGGFLRSGVDKFGNQMKYYNINITRYIQNLVTRNLPNYKMRLFAPYTILYEQYGAGAVAYYNRFCYGRIKVGGGNNPDYKMRLRIIWSKI